MIALPRTLGTHPETGEDVKADYGRFGPYVTAGKGKNGRIPANMSPLTIELNEALELINKRSSGPQELKNLGNHSETGESLILKDGRYGPYITDGKVNASLPREIDVDKLTLDEAIELIKQRKLSRYEWVQSCLERIEERENLTKAWTYLDIEGSLNQAKKLDDLKEKPRDGIIGPRKREKIGFSVIRGGDIVGNHSVMFAGMGEQIILQHNATDRMIFARGAVKAAKWGMTAGKGEYSMLDVLNL